MPGGECEQAERKRLCAEGDSFDHRQEVEKPCRRVGICPRPRTRGRSGCQNQRKFFIDGSKFLNGGSP